MKLSLKTLPCLLCIASMVFAVSCKKEKQNIDQPSVSGSGSSALIADAQQGKPFSGGLINDFTLASKNGEVALLAVNNSTGMIYVIDLKDNDASQAATNNISAPVSTFFPDIAAKLGINPQNMEIINMEVNPVSKAVYLLVENGTNNTRTMVKATKGGSEITVLDLSNVSYSAIKFSSSNEEVNDITWGDDKLYISFSHPSSLAGGLAIAAAPFKHNTTAASRATTVFKTNWGGNYFTDAPLENMVYAEIGSEKYLMGVTVCAPGFSFKTSDVSSGSGLLQVKEYFNLNTGFSLKVFPVKLNNKTYLVELHQDGKIRRVGEKYLDESQSAFNNQAKYLLINGTTVANGLTDDDVKLVSPSGVYMMAAAYSNSDILVINNTGVLSVMGI